MQIPTDMPRLKGYRFPRDIIAYAVWAYHRFALSCADVEDLLAERGVIVSRETVRNWANRFGQFFAACIKRERPSLADKLRSYIKPIRKRAPNADHRAHKGSNNRAEGSHRPTRKREKIMGRLKSPRQAQRFLCAHDQINVIFRPRRYRLSTKSFRHARTDAFRLWDDYTLEMTA